MEFRRIDEMASLQKILGRMFFWSYERGAWQYDIAVGVILIFVLLTPRGWFRDQPQVGMPAAPEQVQLVLVSDDGHRQQYRVDARVLAPPEQTPALQNDLHNALQRALADLGNGRFSITRIEAVRDEKGTVIAYEVEIHR
jgi:hypothetical protein